MRPSVMPATVRRPRHQPPTRSGSPPWRQRTVRSLRQDRREDDEAVDPIPSTRDSETDRELQELRERVKVLERITVDGREAKTIADEIEKLRDR